MVIPTHEIHCYRLMENDSLNKTVTRFFQKYNQLWHTYITVYQFCDKDLIFQHYCIFSDMYAECDDI